MSRASGLSSPGGSPQDSDLGLTAVRIAHRHRAELIEVEKPDDLAPYCRQRGLGLSKAVVGSLLADAPRPAAEPEPTPPSARTRRERIADFAFTAMLVVAGVLWYGFLALLAVVIAIAIINGDFGSGEPFSDRKLRVVDEALVRRGDDLRYVAIVRNTSEKRLAPAVFARGEVLDRDGRRVVRLNGRRSDWRPTLLPGETGVMIDELPAAVGSLPRRLRYETKLLARRGPATGRAKPPLVLGEPSLERGSCGLRVPVEAGRRAPGSGITIVARDATGAISAAGSVALRRRAAERGRQVISLRESRACPSWLQGVETYPFAFPSNVRRSRP
jgi:hypothetical protein